MLRKTRIGLILALAFTVMALTACEKAPAELTPAVLEGQSEHWQAALDYKVNGSILEETTIVTTTITQEEMEEVTVIIQHKNEQPLSIPYWRRCYLRRGDRIHSAKKRRLKAGRTRSRWRLNGRSVQPDLKNI